MSAYLASDGLRNTQYSFTLPVVGIRWDLSVSSSMSGSYPVGSLLRCYFTGRNASFPSGSWTGTALVDSGSGIFTDATGFNFSTDKNRVVIMQRVN